MLLLILLTTIACNKNAFQSPNPSSTKRYQLKGKVVSVDTRANIVNVNSEAVPGFMDAMTMPYPVKPHDALNNLSAGDAVTADLIAQDDKYWLENIVVTGHR